MSSTMESFPANETSPSSRSMWGRLLWKDAREVVPIWITLLLAAMLCLAVTLWMVSKDFAHIAPLYISGHTFIALISVITGVYLLSSEDENRTLHLLRNLPLPPKQIVWQKLLLGAVGVVALACFIAVFTMLLASWAQCSPLQATSTFRFTLANVFLLPLLYLVIALLSSMVSRSHFYGVLIAGAISAGAIAVLEPSWLGARATTLTGRGEIRWLWVALSVVGGIVALVLGANGWAEEKVISKPYAKLQETKTALTGKTMAVADPNPFPVLLWQSFRQSRNLLACCFGLTVVGWIAIIVWLKYGIAHRNQPVEEEFWLVVTMLTLPWTLAVTVLFASSIFLDDKRQNNFLFFQQNRERSKWFWLSRMLPFGAMSLLLLMLWYFFIFDLGPYPFEVRMHPNPREVELLSSFWVQTASQSFLVPFLGLMGIIGIGQYFSMFVRNPILSFVFTGIISVIFACLFAYVVFVNESVWAFVVPTIIAGYLATWWRSKHWLATAQRKGSYLMPLALPVIVFAIVAAAFINHRATEFGDVEIDGNNVAALAQGDIRGLLDSDTARWAIRDIEFGTEDQRQQAATLYADAIELLNREHGKDSWDHGINRMPWSAKKTADYVAENKAAIAKVVEAGQIPVCAPFASTANDETYWGGVWALMEMGLANSHHQILSGNLSAAKQSIDAYDRLCQRSGRPMATRRETGYYGLLVAWADHPDQKLAALKSAIAQLEGTESDIRPTKIISAKGAGTTIDSNSTFGLNMARFYREFGGEQAFMNLQYNVAALQTGDPDGSVLGFGPSTFDLFPWEYQRYLKVGQLRELQDFNFNISRISSQTLRNDAQFDRQQLYRDYINARLQPYVPIDEDRIGLVTHAYYPLATDTIESANWRRYTLLRLGLAAYRIEHDEYPDDLSQLESYYQNRLPLTTNGLMFGWFKSGLGSDLLEAKHKATDSGLVKSADMIADGIRPLLLPFSIDTTKPLPEPIKCEDGKLGIDVQELLVNRPIFVPNYQDFTFYVIDWTVGENH